MKHFEFDEENRRDHNVTSTTLGDYFYFGSMGVVIIGIMVLSTHPMIIFAIAFGCSVAMIFIGNLGVFFLDSSVGRWMISTSLLGMGVCYLFGYRLW